MFVSKTRRATYGTNAPKATPPGSLIDSLLAESDRRGLSNTAVADMLGVNKSYMSKLRKGWRPNRLQPATESRVRSFLESGSGRVGVHDGPAEEWSDGVLYAAARMSETVAKLIDEARAARAGAAADADIVEASKAPPHPSAGGRGSPSKPTRGAGGR